MTIPGLQKILTSWIDGLNGMRCCYKEVKVKISMYAQKVNLTVICEETKFKNNYGQCFSQQLNQNKFVGSFGYIT